MKAASQPDPQPWPTPPPDQHELIRRRAEEIYFRNGRVPSRDAENWAQAEREILQESARGLAVHPTHHPAVVVTVHGVKYVGEYDPGTSENYHAGEFAKGKAVPVRFDRDRMFVKRPNGKELETRIVDSVVVNKAVESSH